MSINFGVKINTWVSAADGDTYGDAQRFFLRGMQALVQANVISMAVSAQPGSPTNADTYVIGPAPSGGQWGSQTAGTIAYWAVDSQDDQTITTNVRTGAWEFYVPDAGWNVYDNNTAAFWHYNGSAWVIASPLKTAVTALATTTLDPTLATSFRINLSNVASVNVVISAGAYDGQDIDILYVQGSATPSAVTFAAAVHGASTPTATINAVSAQRFTWDNTASIWYATAAGSLNM